MNHKGPRVTATARRIYDNCLILAPDDMPLGRCPERRAQWYLINNLAEVVGTNPLTIRLNFEPAGRFGADQEIVTGAKENRCVVCGIHESLTRHHVVPQCVRRLLPSSLKRWCSHDIVALCTGCHQRYGTYEHEYMEDLLRKHNALDEYYNLRRKFTGDTIACLLMRTLQKHDNAIPEAARAKMLDRIRELKNIPETEPIPATLTFPTRTPGLGRFLMSKVTDHFELIRGWRKHFVETMQPRHLPSGWTVDYYPAGRNLTAPERHLPHSQV
jgi:hypothetical protein